MAQVAQKQKVVEAVENDTLTKVQSKDFVKKILAISISNITYLRNLFPEYAYADRKIEELQLKILKEHTHKGAGEIVQWMKGVYDALDQEYLKALIFAVCTDPENPGSVIESYTFAFTYNDGVVETSYTVGSKDSKSAKVPTKAQTKDSARQLLRNLVILTTQMKPLPKNVFMTTRLLYYDENTPLNYQPPGFVGAAENETLGFCIENIRIKAGTIITPHSCMKVRVRAEKDQFEKDENAELKQTNLELDDSQMDCLSQATSNVDIDIPLATFQTQSKTKQVTVDDQTWDQSSQKNTQELGVRCPCLDVEKDGLMIMCSHCNHWQHAICFCLPDNVKAPRVHICHLCAEKENLVCTDPRLTGMSVERQQEVCGLRRILLLCFDTEAITISMICTKLSCNKVLAQRILGKLIMDGAVKVAKGHRQNKLIDKKGLKTVFYREVEHVCKNLARQRGEDVIDSGSGIHENLPLEEKCFFQSNPLHSLNEQTHDTDMEVDSKEQGRKRPNSSLSDENIPGLPESQSSLDAFQCDRSSNGRRSSKRKKMSKYPTVFNRM
ncbi:uncharacterized protein LOC143460118 isoform X2 [Clavelina lepadiformis]|uniref:uncharacterized protein LOC143460118 isoform X2 n=1 Tax=Clavelina lepadiformis TaxID=159417 RepID=UPI004042F754